MFKRPRRRRAARRSTPPETRLEVCANCDSDYVHPVEWREIGDEHWWMLLRCGECGAEREVTVPDSIAQRFDAALETAAKEIKRAAARLDTERMAREVEVFAAALERNLIYPADFRR